MQLDLDFFSLPKIFSCMKELEWITVSFVSSTFIGEILQTSVFSKLVARNLWFYCLVTLLKWLEFVKMFLDWLMVFIDFLYLRLEISSLSFKSSIDWNEVILILSHYWDFTDFDIKYSDFPSTRDSELEWEDKGFNLLLITSHGIYSRIFSGFSECPPDK